MAKNSGGTLKGVGGNGTPKTGNMHGSKGAGKAFPSTAPKKGK